jgi:hypothetical protein
MMVPLVDIAINDTSKLTDVTFLIIFINIPYIIFLLNFMEFESMVKGEYSLVQRNIF